MIDFRYHLVSIVSIFLALAVGIVLGAGPLQGQLGKSLSDRVQVLSEQKDALDAQLRAAKKEADTRDDFETQATAVLVGGRLTGHGVALVVLPGVDAAVVRETRSALEAGSAPIVSETTVLDAYVAEDAKAKRDEATAAASRNLGLDTASLGSETALDTVLAAALAHPTTPPGRVTQPQASAALDSLSKAGLVDVDAAGAKLADCVVIVSAPVVDDDEAVRVATAGRWAALAATVDAGDAGSVVVGDRTSAVAAKNALSVVQAIRDSATASKVSTVDNADAAIGRASIVLALLQQLAGGAGHYGTEDGATAAFAPFPAR